MRVRDDQKMTIDAYKTLYEGSVIFGIRKHCQAINGTPELEDKLQNITHKRNVLMNKVSDKALTPADGPAKQTQGPEENDRGGRRVR